MQIIIEVEDEQIPALKAKASAEGMSIEGWVGILLKKETAPLRRPLKSGLGMLAKYGPAPSDEEIDENRRDMMKGFLDKFDR